MRATIDKDIITAIGCGPVVIPDDYPRDIGWERLRFDGINIVDLATLSAIWVEYVDGKFILHCKEFPNCQLVTMTYADRKKLFIVGGTIGIKTAQQILDEVHAAQIEAVKNFLASKLVTPREMAEVIMVIAGLVAITAIYARTGNATAGGYLTTIMPQLSALPLQKIAAVAPDAYATLKTVFDTYFSKLESI